MADVTDAGLQRLVAGLNQALSHADDDAATNISSSMLDTVGRQLLGLLDEGEDVEWAVAGQVFSGNVQLPMGLLAITPGRVLIAAKNPKLFGKSPEADFVFARQQIEAASREGTMGKSRPTSLLEITSAGQAVTIALIPAGAVQTVASLTEGFINGWASLEEVEGG